MLTSGSEPVQIGNCLGQTVLWEEDVITENAADLNLVRSNKLDLLEQLADDLAHEIKNPLHSMVINLEVLKRRIDRSEREDSSDLMRYVGVLGSELERVNRRIEVLLRLIRPPRGSEDVTLPDVVEEILELVVFEGERQGVAIGFDPGPFTAAPAVPREPTRQIVLNLLLDSIELLGKGGSLSIEANHEGDHLSLVVAGSNESAPHPHRAVHGTAVRPRLSLARALAESFGATLIVRGALAPGNEHSDEPGLRLTLCIPPA